MPTYIHTLVYMAWTVYSKFHQLNIIPAHIESECSTFFIGRNPKNIYMHVLSELKREEKKRLKTKDRAYVTCAYVAIIIYNLGISSQKVYTKPQLLFLALFAML